MKEALQAESSDALPTVLAIPAVSQGILQPGPVSGKQGFPTLHSVRVHPHQAPTIAAHLPALLELGLPPSCKVRSSPWMACHVICFVFCLLLVGGYRLLWEVGFEQQDDVSSNGKPMMCCTAVLLYCCTAVACSVHVWRASAFIAFCLCCKFLACMQCQGFILDCGTVM